MAQNTKPLIATDNSTQTCNTTRMVFSPGSLSCSGSVATVGGGSGNVGIGTAGNPAYYASNGSTLSPFTNVTYSGTNVGIGTVSPTDDLNAVSSVSGGLTIGSIANGIGGIDSNTTLLSSLNNTNNDTSFYAATGTNNSVTFSNVSPALSGTYYGTFVKANESNISYPASTIINNTLSGSNWTMEGWWESPTLPTTGQVYSFLGTDNTSTTNFVYLGIYNDAGVDKFTISYSLSGSNTQPIYTITPNTNTWYYWEFIKSGSTLTACWNGLSIGSSSVNPTQIIGTNSGTIDIGSDGGSFGDWINGNMQEIRLSNVARNSGVCSAPPTSPYTSTMASPQLTFNLPAVGTQTGFINTNGNNSNYLQIGQGSTTAITVDNNENVGIGSASPGVDLDVTGTIRATNFIGNGSGLTGILPNASAGQFYGATSANTPGAVSNLNFSTSNNNVYFNGNVGIGSVNPIEPLDVGGIIRTVGFTIGTSGVLTGAIGTGSNIVTDNAPTITGVTTLNTASVTNVIKGGATNASILTQEGTSAAAPTVAAGITWDYGVNGNFSDLRQQGITGNIGIGSYVNGNVMGNILNVAGGVGIGTGSSSQFINASAPNGGLIVEGNVGIGTTVFDSFDNPTLAVVNYASSPATIIIQSPTNGTANLDFTSSASSNPNPTGRISQIRTNLPSNGNTDLAFYTNNSGGAGFTEKMRISAMGNVGIGSVAPGQILDVKGTIRISNLGSTLSIIGGTNGCHGVNALTTGAVTISTACTPSVAQNIVVWDAGGGTLANIGSLSVGTVTGGTSFVCNSSNTLDSSNCGWFILGNS